MLTETRSCKGFEMINNVPTLMTDEDIIPTAAKLFVEGDIVTGVDCTFKSSGGMCERPIKDKIYLKGRSLSRPPCGAFGSRFMLPLLNEVGMDSVISNDTPTFPPIVLQRGGIYFPFRGMNSFSTVDWEKVIRPDPEFYEIALERYLVVNGILGAIQLEPFYTENEDDYKSADKPLGSVRVEKEYGDSDEEDSILLAPLRFSARFEPKTYTDFQLLENQILRISCGENTYYLNCYGPEDEDEAITESDFDEVKDYVVVIDDQLINRDGDNQEALLPWDFNKLGKIKIELLTNDDFNEE